MSNLMTKNQTIVFDCHSFFELNNQPPTVEWDVSMAREQISWHVRKRGDVGMTMVDPKHLLCMMKKLMMGKQSQNEDGHYQYKLLVT